MSSANDEDEMKMAPFSEPVINYFFYQLLNSQEKC
jgi:hypothetical protein